MDGGIGIKGGLKEDRLLMQTIDGLHSVLIQIPITVQDPMFRILWEAHYWMTAHYNKHYCKSFRRYDIRDEHRDAAKWHRFDERG